MIKRATGTPGLRSTAPVRVALKQDHLPENSRDRAPRGLENYANNHTPPLTSADAARDRAYDLRRGLWQVSALPRLRKCGRVPRGEEVAVVYSVDRGAGFAGLCTCGSVHACPVCSRKIMAARSVEIGTALTEWERQTGGQAVFVTLTMRHGPHHALRQELDALAVAWQATARSRVWAKQLLRLGSPGWLRVLEITIGPNGWHAHYHLVLLVAPTTSAADVREFTGWLFPKWNRAVLAAGMPGALAIGQDAHLVSGATAAADMSVYLSKAGYSPAEAIGRELMGSWSKSARSMHGTVPHWRLAEGFFETGEAELLERWGQYERATKGRRQITWARGLRDLLAVGDEQTDEDIADQSAGDDAAVFITAAGWQTVLRLPEPSSRILTALNQGGPSGLRAYLDAHGVAYRVPELSGPSATEVHP